ncbi:MAG: IclR family transcriptional regulator C-terminal domain-containing protein, partial [Pseudolabrys sp.]
REYASDVGAVAAGVRNMDGRTLAVVTITVPAYRFSTGRQTELMAMVEATAAVISAQQGYRPQTVPKIR